MIGSIAEARALAALPPNQLRAWLDKCGPRDLLMLDAAFEMWANDGQIEPVADGWRNWLMMAGRGFGKTRAGAEWIHKLAMSPGRRIAIVGATIDEARSIMIEGVSGLLSVARRHRCKVTWEPSKGEFRWPKGSVATLYSGDKPDGLRGPELHYAWADELAKWRGADEAWTNLQLALRGGVRPRVLVTTTPRPMRLLEAIGADPRTVTTGGRTADNLSLPRAFIEAMAERFGGTRLGRQELDGELMAEAEGSLFPRDLLERALRYGPSPGSSPGSVPTQDERPWDRVVVGVDPPVSVGGDACGIVVAGRRDGVIHVLADCSVEQARPEIWARVVAAAARTWGASHVVAEGNQGGDMVTSVLKAADAALRVKVVHASRGKVARAEPVAVLFETGKAVLAGVFPELEAELAGLTVGGAYAPGSWSGPGGPGRSPDRADAMVWAVTELSETKSGVPRVLML